SLVTLGRVFWVATRGIRRVCSDTSAKVTGSAGFVSAAAGGGGSAGRKGSGSEKTGGVTSLTRTSSHRAWARAGRPRRPARNAGMARTAAHTALARPIARSVDMGEAPFTGPGLLVLVPAVQLVDQGAE